MSTFEGRVKEFPDIRIDYFRSSPSSRKPLAYFLSHVHSDHLQGLESCKSPFIYCSPATREILLRLEKYPHRMNFAKGILESRKQTYRHLGKLLKTITLETPTMLELSPGRSIRVTLFDANHCVGAVMFLIEDDKNAVLYTGDIRSELWWVNALTRHPLLIPYAHLNGRKPLRKLDCMYLDTTFADKSDPYKHFAPKAEGISELLGKVSKYPPSTIFYFDSWTFGYEDVWVALSSFLGCQIHVDRYRYMLYRALVAGGEPKAPEGPRLYGFQCGNHLQKGCLTESQTRLHSCEQGTGCEVFKKGFVRITPLISRHEGVEMAELGAGGGKGDLDQQHELEVDDTSALGMLMSLCATKMQGQPHLLASVLEMLALMIKDPVSTIALDTSALLSAHGMDPDDAAQLDQLPLDSLVPALVKLAEQSKAIKGEPAQKLPSAASATFSSLPSRIVCSEGITRKNKDLKLTPEQTFPYSRHSSYTELCHLIDAFKPADIFPCTVEHKTWTAANSMSFLFGHLYDGLCKFSHDQVMFERTDMNPSDASQEVESNSSVNERHSKHHNADRSSTTTTRSPMIVPNEQLAVKEKNSVPSSSPLLAPQLSAGVDTRQQNAVHAGRSSQPVPGQPVQGPDTQLRRETVPTVPTKRRRRSSSTSSDIAFVSETNCVQRAMLSDDDYANAYRQEAHDAALGDGWCNIGLVSVCGHQEREHEL